MSLIFNIDTDVNESLYSDIAEYDVIETPEIIYELLGDTIILERFCNNIERLFERIVDVAVCCWNVEYNGDKLQHTPIKLKSTDTSDVTYMLPLNKLMMSMPFIKPLAEYMEFIDLGKFIIQTAKFTKKDRGVLQDNLVEELKKYGKSIDEINEIISEMSYDLKSLLIIFSKADMPVYTSESLLLDQYMASEVIRDINNTEYPLNKQTCEIVEENKAKYEILKEKMLELGNPFFEANEFAPVIKPKQMEEVYINFAQIPDGSRKGNLVDIIMNGNGTKHGYESIPVFYAGAIAARVPDIYNEDFMGSAGYFSRNLMILTYGTLSQTVYDCGSKNTIAITIEEKTMGMYHGRYYYLRKNSEILRVFHKDDKHLIGKTLYFRSPCKCNLNEDVCHVCYGSVALKVGNLKGGFVYTTELTTSRVQQNVLSVKHILKADAEPIIFTGAFDKYFDIESSAVIPKDENRFDIYIKEDYQDDLSNGFTMYIGKDLVPIGITNYASINIASNVIEKGKEVVINEETYIKISSYKVLENNNGILCNITPRSISSLAVYMNIMKLFENDVTKFDTIDEAVVALTEMLNEVMPVMATHGEIMLSKLLRRPDNVLLRPNFLEEDAPYQIVRLKTALQNAEAVTTGLAFEQTKHHVLRSILDKRNQINRVGPVAFSDYMFGEGRI